jgi:hypothetical protein
VTVMAQSRSFDVLGLDLDGHAAVPEAPVGLVLMLRGPGGFEDDERDLAIARELNNVHIATVQVDLLTRAEQRIDAATASPAPPASPSWTASGR